MVSPSHSADSLISLCTLCYCLQDSAAPGNEQGYILTCFFLLSRKQFLKLYSGTGIYCQKFTSQDAIKSNVAERK